MLIRIDDQRITLFLRDHDRDDLVAEDPCGLRGGPALLAADGKSILIGAADVIVGGDIVGGFRHRMGAVDLFHHRVREAPADGGVVDRIRA